MPVTWVALPAMDNVNAPVPHATSMTRSPEPICDATLLRRPDISGSMKSWYSIPLNDHPINTFLSGIKIA
jgi:hypothetical protein